MNLNDTKLLQVIDGLIKEREALLYLKEAVTLIADNRAQLESTAATLAAAKDKLAAMDKEAIERVVALSKRLAEKQKVYEQRLSEMDEDVAKRQAAADIWKASLARTEAEHAAHLATWQLRIDAAKQELTTVNAQLDQANAHRASLMASLQPA